MTNPVVVLALDMMPCFRWMNSLSKATLRKTILYRTNYTIHDQGKSDLSPSMKSLGKLALIWLYFLFVTEIPLSPSNAILYDYFQLCTHITVFGIK